MTTTWSLTELVTFGIERQAEAERQGARHIFVEEIHSGATRISSRIIQHACIVHVYTETAREAKRAFALLHHSRDGWYVADLNNCAGDRAVVNARLRDIKHAAAAGAA